VRLLLVYTEVQIKYGSYAFQHGLAALAAYVKQAGDPQVSLCYVGPKWNNEGYRDRIRRFRPDVIGFYVTEDQLRFVRKLLNDGATGGAFTLFGGPYASLNPEIIEQERRLDAVCIGEGELPTVTLLDTLARRQEPAEIPGLWVRRGSEIIRTHSPPYIEDLDSLPFVDREIFEAAPELKHVGITQISHRNSFRVSRGCPFKCSFCSNHRLARNQEGTFTRLRSVPLVMQEVRQVVGRYRPKEIYFDDDTFTLKESFVDEFVEAYPATSTLPFEFFSHVGPTALRVLEKLRGVGGRRVSFGIESGNEHIRNKVLGKSFSNDRVEEVFREARRMGYQVEAFLMVGLPDETPEAFDDTVELMRRIQPDLYSLSIYFPFRGTDLYEHALRQGYLDGPVDLDDTFVSRRRALLDMPAFPPAAVARAVRNFPLRVYGRPSLRKALLFRAYESPLGDPLLQALAPVKRLLRDFVLRG